jgi:hypothetical protein
MQRLGWVGGMIREGTRLMVGAHPPRRRGHAAVVVQAVALVAGTAVRADARVQATLGVRASVGVHSAPLQGGRGCTRMQITPL